jgi:cyclase
MFRELQMKQRFSITTLFAALMLAAFFITDGGAQANTMKKIADGVWFREGDIKNLGHCNNIIIEMKDYLIVVDANFPSGARLAIADAKKVSPKPVKYVFITHHHGDHDYGSAVWTAAGATTFAYKGVAEEMKRYEPNRWRDTIKTRPDVAGLKLAAPPPPQQTFDKSPYVLSDSTREVQFHFFGWAHTRGDGFAWLPKEKILCTGDAAANGPYNYTADGNIGNWPKVMEAALKLDPKFVLPGHGPSGGPEILTGQASFMTELRKAVQQEVAQGKTPDKNLKLPSNVQNWIGPSLSAQVKDAYNEVTQKKAAGELPH